MIIELPKISPDGSQYTGEESAEILGLGDQKLVRVESPVRYDFFAQRISDELVVKGTVSVTVGVACCRCTEFFSTTLEDSSFLRSYEAPEGLETVDLTEDIREDILLELPAYPVCVPDCKGLCPRCGKNLNTGRCSCRPPTLEGPWGSLDSLKLK